MHFRLDKHYVPLECSLIWIHTVWNRKISRRESRRQIYLTMSRAPKLAVSLAGFLGIWQSPKVIKWATNPTFPIINPCCFDVYPVYCWQCTNDTLWLMYIIFIYLNEGKRELEFLLTLKLRTNIKICIFILWRWAYRGLSKWGTNKYRNKPETDAALCISFDLSKKRKYYVKMKLSIF